MAIHWIDMTIIVVYLVGITGVGLWFSRRQRHTSAGYFLAGRSLGWVTVGLALFATNISTVHLTGLAGAGFSEGMVVGNFEWLAPFLLILLGLVFAPFYFRTRISTLPEYLEGRYGPASRTVLAFMAVVGALFIHIGVTLYAGAEVLKTLIEIHTPDWWSPLAPYLDFNIAVSIGIVSLLTIVYTALGGLKAVVVTESVQTVLLLLGAAAVTVFGLVELADRGATSLTDIHRMSLEQEARDAGERSQRLGQTADVFATLDSMRESGETAEAGIRLDELADALEASHTSTAVLEGLAGSRGDPAAAGLLARRLGDGDAAPLGSSSADFSSHVEALKTAAAAERDYQVSLEANAGSEAPRSTRLSMIRTSGDYTWWIMLLGYPILGIWYWCADQTIVQRVLGARSEWDAQVGPIFAGFIKVLPVFLMVFPGVIAYVLFRDKIGENADATLSVLILRAPAPWHAGPGPGRSAGGDDEHGGRRLELDRHPRQHRHRPASPARTPPTTTLVRIGQMTAVVVMIVAVAWSTQGARFGGIFAGINQMISVLAPPISTVFIWGIFWRRGTSAAALTTSAGRFRAGCGRLRRRLPRLWAWSGHAGMGHPLPAAGLDPVRDLQRGLRPVSLLTPPPPRECLHGYCWPNPGRAHRATDTRDHGSSRAGGRAGSRDGRVLLRVRLSGRRGVQGAGAGSGERGAGSGERGAGRAWGEGNGRGTGFVEDSESEGPAALSE